MEVPNDPAIPTPSMYLKKLKAGTYTPTFITALFKRTKGTNNQSPSKIDKWKNKMQQICEIKGMIFPKKESNSDTCYNINEI